MIMNGFKIYIDKGVGEKTRGYIKLQVEKKGGKIVEKVLKREDANVVLSYNTKFDDYPKMNDLGVPVVHPKWFFESLKHGMVLEMDQYFTTKTQILNNATITVAMSQFKLCHTENMASIVKMLGAEFREKLDTQCTHVIGLKKDDNLFIDLLKQIPNILIVSYQWLNKIIETNQYIKEDSFLLYSRKENNGMSDKHEIDKCLSASENQKTNASNGMIESNTNDSKDSNPDNLKTLFKDISFYVSSSYADEIRIGMIENIKFLGGVILDRNELGKARYVICQHKNCEEYEISLKNHNTNIVSGHYIDDCIRECSILPIHHQRLSKINRILYFPICGNHGIPGMNHLVISISRFSNSERLDIIYLVKWSGATYTGEFSKKNDILIVKKGTKLDNSGGEKVKKAMIWGKHIVDEEWILNCFDHWRFEKLEEYDLYKPQHVKN